MAKGKITELNVDVGGDIRETKIRNPETNDLLAALEEEANINAPKEKAEEKFDMPKLKEIVKQARENNQLQGYTPPGSPPPPEKIKVGMNGAHIKVLGAIDDSYIRIGDYAGVRKYGEHLDLTSFFPSVRQDERILVFRQDIRKLGEVLVEIGKLKETGDPFEKGPVRQHI